MYVFCITMVLFADIKIQCVFVNNCHVYVLFVDADTGDYCCRCIPGDHSTISLFDDMHVCKLHFDCLPQIPFYFTTTVELQFDVHSIVLLFLRHMNTTS